MHPVDLSEGEVELLKEARKKNDWTILPTPKLRYIYQRLVALPRGDMKSVREIAAVTRKSIENKPHMIKVGKTYYDKKDLATWGLGVRGEKVIVVDDQQFQKMKKEEREGWGITAKKRDEEIERIKSILVGKK